MTDKSIKEQYQEKAQEVSERPSKMKDKTLSDKISYHRNMDNPPLDSLPVKDVKDFIQKLKGRIPRFIEDNLQMKPSEKLILFGKFCKEIDKLAGDALIHSPAREPMALSERKGETGQVALSQALLLGTPSSGTHSQQTKHKRKTLALGWEDGAHDKIIELADKADKQSDVYHNEVVKRFKESSGNASCANRCACCGKIRQRKHSAIAGYLNEKHLKETGERLFNVCRKCSDEYETTDNQGCKNYVVPKDLKRLGNAIGMAMVKNEIKGSDKTDSTNSRCAGAPKTTDNQNCTKSDGCGKIFQIREKMYPNRKDMDDYGITLGIKCNKKHLCPTCSDKEKSK